MLQLCGFYCTPSISRAARADQIPGLLAQNKPSHRFRTLARSPCISNRLKPSIILIGSQTTGLRKLRLDCSIYPDHELAIGQGALFGEDLLIRRSVSVTRDL